MYYTIENDNLLIAENEQALTRFYNNVYPLPEDYEDGKYIIGEKEEEIDVLTYETVEEEITVFDENGEPITEKTTVKNPVMIEIEEEIPIFDENGNENGTTTVKKQVQATHKENRTVKILVLNPNFEAEKLLKLKKQKNAENTAKAKEAIENGYVVFKNAQFETNSQTVGDLTATMLMLQQQQGESVQWLSKDDKVVELSVHDIGTLGGLIADFKNDVWNEKYLFFKMLIAQAQTVEDVMGIQINYAEETEH